MKTIIRKICQRDYAAAAASLLLQQNQIHKSEKEKQK